MIEIAGAIGDAEGGEVDRAEADAAVEPQPVARLVETDAARKRRS